MSLLDTIKQNAQTNRPKPAPLIIPEWGLTEEAAAEANGSPKAFVRVLTAAELDEFTKSLIKIKDGKRDQDQTNFRAKFVAACAEDSAGALLFADEVKWLGAQPTPVIDAAFRQCQEVNGIGEDHRKNSSATDG